MEKRIELNEMKKIELDILLEFDRLCQVHGFRYFLCGGTLLGAVRHKGFIPWDDDIDVSMPRPDYDKFIEIVGKNEEKFDLFSHEICTDYTLLFAKMCAKNTIAEEINIKQCTHGIWIDIFPIDGLGSDEKTAKRYYKSTQTQQYLLLASRWKKYFRGTTAIWYVKLIRLGLYLCGKFIRNPQKLIYKIEQRYKKFNFDTSKYCGAVCGNYGIKEIFKREILSEYIDIQFENHTFKALKEYDVYLTALYGDYMQLPPIEKRVSHHNFNAYYTDAYKTE